jgi:hypothetical protein
LPLTLHIYFTQDAVPPRLTIPAGVWLYNRFAVGGLGVDDTLCGVTWPQLKSVMEAKKTRLNETGMSPSLQKRVQNARACV